MPSGDVQYMFFLLLLLSAFKSAFAAYKKKIQWHLGYIYLFTGMQNSSQSLRNALAMIPSSMLEHQEE